MTDTFSNANLGKYAMQVLNALREENLSYLEKTRERRQALDEETRFATEKVRQKLEDMVNDFKHQAEMKKIEQAAALKRAEMAAKEATQRYETFLGNVGTLRDKITEHYPRMSPAYVDIIYHRACELLNAWFNAADEEEGQRHKNKLMLLIKRIHEDTEQDSLADPKVPKLLPTRTIEYVEKER